MLAWVDLTLLKRLTLFFWAAWLGVVAITNVLDASRVVSFLPPDFPFVSGNWSAINRVMDPLRIPRGLQAFAFSAVICWEAVASWLFWRALAAYRGRSLVLERETLAACAVNLALWIAFQVLDELVLAYPQEGAHRAIFVNQIATIVVLQISGDPENSARRISPPGLSLEDVETLADVESPFLPPRS